MFLLHFFLELYLYDNMYLFLRGQKVYTCWSSKKFSVGELGKQDTIKISSVQFSLSVVSDSVIPWTAEHQASQSITNSRSLLKLMSIKSVMPSNHLIVCRPLLLLPSIFPSIRIFSNESVLHITCPKYWSFSFNISPSNEYSDLISFRIDWFDLLAVQGTLKVFYSTIIKKLLFFSAQSSL